jgi:hypothetical protein
MGLFTKVGSAKKGTRSLKTTIPEGIVEFLELTDRDELDWRMVVQGDDRHAIVRKKTGGASDNSAELARLSLKQKKERGDL